MLRCVALVVVVVAILALRGDALPTRPGPDDPVDSSGGCTVSGHFMAVGEVFNTGPDPCHTYTCHAVDAVFALNCAYWTAGPGCEIVPGNQTAVYPECCPKEVCSDNLINVDA